MVRWLRHLVLTLFVVAPWSLILPPPGIALGQSSSAQCAGADVWLSESEDRFRSFEPPFTELINLTGLSATQLSELQTSESDGRVADQHAVDAMVDAILSSDLAGQFPHWAAAAESSMRDQAASTPPGAATRLNDQLVVVLGSYGVAFAALSDALAGIAATGAASPDVLTVIANAVTETDAEVSQARSLARALKLACNLTASGEFFDPECYGAQALDWYTRTNGRIFDLSNALDQPGSQDTITDLRQQQEADMPPASLASLNALYLSFYDDALAVVNGLLAPEVFLQRLGDLGRIIDAEKARLDIACAERGA